MIVGILAWAYTLLLPSFADAGLLGQGILDARAVRHRVAAAAAPVRPRPAAAGARRGVEPGAQHPRLCRRSRSRARRRSIERLQADLFVPSELAPIAPSFRLWRSSVTVEELTTTVARYLGEERTRIVVRELRRDAAASASIPSSEADFQLLRYAEHLLASAIGAASSRLVLSLLLRKRTVSTKAALKLLDDANAAIHYNREILQTALDHVRQGIAVFDKDLRLVCWNRQFGEILDLPPQLTRVGIGLDEILRFNAEHGALGPGRVDDARARAASRATSPAASRSSSASPTAAWSSRCAPTACRTAASSPPSPTSRRASKRPRRSSAPTRRWSGACASAPRS